MPVSVVLTAAAKAGESGAASDDLGGNTEVLSDLCSFEWARDFFGRARSYSLLLDFFLACSLWYTAVGVGGVIFVAIWCGGDVAV